jgi:hypothetical protein
MSVPLVIMVITATAITTVMTDMIASAVVATLIAVIVRMSVLPQHELLYYEKDPQAHHERDADSMSAGRADVFHGFRQKGEQRGPQQRAGGKADEMGQEPSAEPFGHQQEHTRECGACDAAERSEQDDPAEQRQGVLLLLKGSRHRSMRDKDPLATRSSQINAAMRPHLPSRRNEKNRAASL